MHPRKISLALTNGKQVTCLVGGKGPRVVYIMGAGSFYIQSLLNLPELANNLTFVTCDRVWVQDEDNPLLKEADIQAITLESLLDEERLVVEAIREYFKCKKIGLFGFSAPAALALRYALENPKDIASVIATGAGLCQLDPSFALTDQVFKERASKEKIQQHESAVQNYQKILENAKDAEPLANSHFAPDPQTGKLCLTPRSHYREQTRSLGPKALYAYPKHTQEFLEHWKSNPLGQSLSTAMRLHFFGKLQPQLDTLTILEELEKQGKVPVLLAHGKQDYVTPADEKVIDKLAGYHHIKLDLYDECAHLPYIEKSEDYTRNVVQFVSQSIPVKALNAEKGESLAFNLANSPQSSAHPPSKEDSKSDQPTHPTTNQKDSKRGLKL